MHLLTYTGPVILGFINMRAHTHTVSLSLSLPFTLRTFSKMDNLQSIIYICIVKVGEIYIIGY